jgi:alkanesulfonate monooxygenase SsuD/methylene tetrahydromethanopterin reductase-like flavin-dependent oxidoreductase (luciferase family)
MWHVSSRRSIISRAAAPAGSWASPDPKRLDLPRDGADAAARMVELVEVARQLWDSWEERAFVVDQATGTFTDSERVRPIHHQGRFFTVRGPLNVPRPVQGQPVILYRDRPSDIARAGMAESAEVVLSEPATLADAKAARSEWRALATQHGRDAESLRFVVRIMPILAASDAAARKRATDLDALASANTLVRFVGTPEAFAAWMAEWVKAGACDGFDLLPAVMTTDMDLIADAVVPSLRQSGFRTSGSPSAGLRGMLGLRHVDSRFAA